MHEENNINIMHCPFRGTLYVMSWYIEKNELLRAKVKAAGLFQWDGRLPWKKWLVVVESKNDRFSNMLEVLMLFVNKTH